MAVQTDTSNASLGGNGNAPEKLVGRDGSIAQLRSTIETVARRNCTVLICGESGTGKELVARLIHAASPRAAAPFVTVDCTTLRDTLLESQLFGHVKGAFTGAEQSTLGLFRAADGGTLLFDEIGELDLPMQAKLLRCIQEKAVVPLGAVDPIPVDVRILAATHRDLSEMVRRGQFREDLYFRINVVRLDVPPLRDRCADIVPLAEHFLEQHAHRHREPLRTLSECARTALQRYGWPGNIRELWNAIEHALVFFEGDHLTASDLPPALRQIPGDEGGNGRRERRNGQPKVVPLHVAERCLIKRALRASDGNQVLAARMLGIERHRLARMIQRHGLRTWIRSKALCSR